MCTDNTTEQQKLDIASAVLSMMEAPEVNGYDIDNFNLAPFMAQDLGAGAVGAVDTGVFGGQSN